MRRVEASGTKSYDLSPTQLAMLLHSVRDPHGGLWVEQLVLNLTLHDLQAFRQSWQNVVARHDALRTSFRWEGLETPVQVVAVEATLPLEVVDWRGAAREEHQHRLQAYLAADRRRGFDLAEAPLVRLLVARVGEHEYNVVKSHHHIVMDAWSGALVLREVEELLDAERVGRRTTLPPAVQFGAYIDWLHHQDEQEAERFWRRHLAGFDEPLPLPGERGASPSPSMGTRFVGHRLTLTGSQTSALRSLAQRWQVTPSTVANAAWAMVLSAWSGETDVVFGTTSSGRPPQLEGVEGIVGLFITTVPLRAHLDLNRRAAEWVQDLHARSAEARAFQHVSPLALQAWSELPGNVPLFESIVTYNSGALGRRSLRPLADGPSDHPPSRTGRALEVARPEPSNHPLAVTFEEVGDVVTLGVTADSRRVEEGTAARLLEQLRTVIGGLAARPRARLGEIGVLPHGERAKVLHDWNATRVEVPRGACLHDLVSGAVRTDPDRPALVTRDGQVTAGSLERRANRLARHLVSRGVGPEVLVGVALERSVDLHVALLAVLKAGGGCVPLDPVYPLARRRHMLEDSGATLLITDGRPTGLEDHPGLPVLRIPADDSLWAEEDGAAAPGGAQPENVAFVLYTSGSTGTPKGVVLPHRVCVNRLSVEGDPITGEDVLCCTTSPNFIDSIWESFGAWVHGARTVLVPPAEVPDPERFVELIGGAGVSRLLTVPSLLRTVLESGAATRERLPRLRVWVCSGEALPRDLSRLFVEAFPDVVLSDLYGTTETWDVTRFDSSAFPPDEALPIGRPFGNATAYVLDQHLRPLPLGAPGELYVGGRGLSRGYHGRPAMTAERFVPDPFGAHPGARLYRTGDRARWRPDGQLELLGRIDQQVKVRGFRVEPGEIESVLRLHPQVHRAAVAVTPRSQVLACIVPLPGERPTSVHLRRHVRAHVPAHEVPSIYRLVEEIPLTPSGKVDRRSLLELAVAEGEGEHDQPLGPDGGVTATVASVWTEVLGVQQVGKDDDFFELGGHSLLVARLATRLRERLGRPVPVRAVFEAPTVRGLADWLASAPEEEPDELPDLVVHQARPDGSRVAPQSFAQQRLWFLGQVTPDTTLYTTRGSMPLPGPGDVEALRRALDALVARHETLRTVFAVAAGGEPVQVVQPPEPAPLLVRDVPPDGDLAAELRWWWQGGGALDPARGPLVRFALLRSGSRHVLAWRVHHLVTDGWSTAILRRELRALYTAFRDGVDPGLQPLTAQYADFSVWQHRAIGGVLEQQLAYWRAALEGAPLVLDLPTDRPRREGSGHRAARHTFRLDRRLVGRLEGLAHEEEATLFMVLLAACGFVLGRHAGKDDVVVGSPVANRPRIELEGLIGLFVNTLALRVDLRGRPTFRQLLSRVRETCLGAYAHQDLPFERLVDELAPDRDPSVPPVCQAMLSLLQDDPERGGAGATPAGAGPDAEEAGAIFFDLTLTFTRDAAGLSGHLHHRADLFDASTGTRLADHLAALLETVVDEPDARLSPSALITAQERALLATGFAGGPVPGDGARCVHELFEECASRDPDHVAVEHHGRQVSYRELDRWANRLAHRLLRLGARPEMRVALCSEPSPAAVAALIAILKVGGVYVPIDPVTPRDRLRWLLDDAEPAVVVCAAPAVASIPDHWALLPLPDDETELDESPARPPVRVSPACLAYVVYTSGSTGRPKGVLVEHRNLAHTVRGQASRFGLTPDSRVLATISWTFDASLGEMFRTLTSGAALVLADRADLVGPGLLELWRAARIDVCTVATAVLAALPRKPDVPGLRTLSVGGEALAGDLARHWGAGRRLLNGYGPTETTIGATLASDWSPGRRPPLGRPLPGVAAYVVDADLELQPIGVPGELCLAGPGVSRGYLHRSGLTAERYLPDPFADAPGLRMYRTGDRARWLPDGQLEFLGRLDDQVKIRGHRVEPDEVADFLREQPGVRDAVVTARDDGGGVRLVAYTVGDAEPADLVASLRTSLPEHLVPSAVVRLPELPRTPHGKVDRAALPEPASVERPHQEHVAPCSPTERALAAIWADLLPVDRVGVHDNFFDLGGDSLLSVRVMARANEAGIRLETRDVYRLHTVAEQAAAAARAAVTQEQVAQEAPQGPVTGSVPLTPAQHWFLEHPDPELDQITWAGLVAPPERLTRRGLERAVQAFVHHHDALRLRLNRANSGEWQLRLAEPEVRQRLVTVVDLGGHDPAKRRGVLEARVARLRATLALRQGPVLRVIWFRSVVKDRDALVLVVHHLAVDSVSWPVLVEDLSTLLKQHTEGLAGSLPAKTASVRQWAEHLVEAAASDAVLAELALWTDDARRHVLPLPRDGAGRNSRASEQTVTTTAGADETRAILKAVAHLGVTAEEAVLGAVASAVSRWAGARSCLVNVERHGREDLGAGLDVSRTVGWLPMIVPVLLDRPPGSPARAAVRLTSRQLRRLPNHGMGHGLLRYLGPEEARAALAALPSAEVFYCFHGHQRAAPGEFSAPQGRPLDLGRPTGHSGDRRHLLEVNAVVSGDRLVLRWTHSDAVLAPSTVRALTQDCLAELRELASVEPPVAGPETPRGGDPGVAAQRGVDEGVVRIPVPGARGGRS